ncbi:hypothetical protein DACRYDRAFT_109751 [Dacryopinax primogenitus]|uniref:CENP-V/GFA domain-containing protein n=1 Tax=Dacryopinax primogenitus (strain DJM 731) TaxID=1858805 RepID=M5G1E4_DACPD|nr:uncharacterized protein DACRYDRAFT_109751 [Dacryopinax primogenitus]EJT99646.1 hypothetical protein DACRYDRAFT_109751 [Dacryopinax primogenitus]
MPDYPTVYATCHCHAHRFPVFLDPSTLPKSEACCHCDVCRHSAGVPFVTCIRIPHALFPLTAPDPDNTTRSNAGDGHDTALPKGITSYRSSGHAARYFCSICGCHIAMHFCNQWFLSVGCITFPSLPEPGLQEEEMRAVDGIYKISWHQYLEDTGDGGIMKLMDDGLPRYAIRTDGALFSIRTSNAPAPTHSSDAPIKTKTGDVLTARCRCGSVRASILRPSAIPSGPGVAKRGSSDGQRWLSGHCMCTDCRLTSGYPVSSWTYVGREHLKLEGEGLVYYQSSQRAKRGFCRTCGASVMWDGGGDTVDIATALFERNEGEGVSAVEREWTWLEGGVSFAGDARDRGMKANASTGA